ncbi:hypothetical protein K435DRAFT_880782 [Dendrothele bispora CBS 962.96]|uniref:Uncharacterized protein n=1 Tax=Dendrothele bispora (strain CBS 962.96) TaxID=1314807 RepID=A0A4S8KK27_DENBC|nr:hypothetical protein K435DRAFT_880782 [Dendrothele bispora CBS 962.96]
MTSLQGKACDLKSGSHLAANSQKDGGTHVEVSIRALVQKMPIRELNSIT